MRKILRKSVLLMLVMSLLVGGMVTTTFAATKSLKKQGFTTSTSTADKKAITVKKGTTTVKLSKKGTGYLKFKATATKTYSFKLSGLKSGNGRYSCGYFYVMRKYGTAGQYIGQEKLKTYGGKNSALYVATKNSTYSTKKLYQYRTSRTGKIKLNKGEMVYLYFSFSSKDQLKLKIS